MKFMFDGVPLALPDGTRVLGEPKSEWEDNLYREVWKVNEVEAGALAFFFRDLLVVAHFTIEAVFAPPTGGDPRWVVRAHGPGGQYLILAIEEVGDSLELVLESMKRR